MIPASVPRAPHPGHEGGFSFIEVIIAMSVLVVGSISVLGLFAIGVNRMVQRRVDARLAQVRPQIESILQSEVDNARAGAAPQDITREHARPLSRRGYALAVRWRPSPFETPGVVAHAELLYQGQVVRTLLLPLRRAVLDKGSLEDKDAKDMNKAGGGR